MEIANYCAYFRKDTETCGNRSSPTVISGNVCPWADSDKDAKNECPHYQDKQIAASSKKNTLNI